MFPNSQTPEQITPSSSNDENEPLPPSSKTKLQLASKDVLIKTVELDRKTIKRMEQEKESNLKFEQKRRGALEAGLVELKAEVARMEIESKRHELALKVMKTNNYRISSNYCLRSLPHMCTVHHSVKLRSPMLYVRRYQK